MGHEIVFEWVPSHCDTIGNEAAYHAVKVAHTSAQHLAVPCLAADSNRLVREMGKSSSFDFWQLRGYRHPRLYALDPQLTFRFPPDVPNIMETVLHRLRLAVLFTGHNLFKIKQIPSPDCLTRGTDKKVTPLTMDCAFYVCERAARRINLQNLYTGPFTISKVLEAWCTSKKTCAAPRAVVKFLVNSGLSSKL